MDNPRGPRQPLPHPHQYLSKEMFNTVWARVCPPQRVDIQSSSSGHFKVTRTGGPPILFAHYLCQAYAVGRFNPAFANGEMVYPIFVDFEADTFRIGWDVLDRLARSDLARIRILETKWDYLRIFNTGAGIPDPLDFCTGLHTLVLVVRYSFLSSIVITTEDPDWAKLIAILDPYDGDFMKKVNQLKTGWDEKLAALAADFDRRRQEHPGWTTPKVVIKFVAWGRG
jgi:hypothetical protein